MKCISGLNQSNPDSPAEWASVFESNLSTKERLLANKKLFDSIPMSTDAALEVTREGGLCTTGAHASAGSEMDNNTTLGNVEHTTDTTWRIVPPKQECDQSKHTTTMGSVTIHVGTDKSEEDKEIEENNVKTKEEVLSPQKWAISEADRRAIEAERRAEAAEKRAVEAEKRATRAEGKAADVERWSCVLQAVMDSAVDRAKCWEERALRAELALAKEAVSLSATQQQRPASVEVGRSAQKSVSHDGDQVPNEVGVNGERTNGTAGASGVHVLGRASEHLASSVEGRGCNSIEQEHATERHTIGIGGRMEGSGGTAIAVEDVSNGPTSINGLPNGMEERDSGDDEVVRSDSPQGLCASPNSLQPSDHEETKL